MSTDDQSLPTGNDIVDAARNTGDGLTYKLYGHSYETPSGQPKDAHFVGDMLDKAGLGFGDNLSDRPTIADWADPKSNIPGWQTVGDGSIQPGDVLATAKPIPLNSYHGGGQQLGIARRRHLARHRRQRPYRRERFRASRWAQPHHLAVNKPSGGQRAASRRRRRPTSAPRFKWLPHRFANTVSLGKVRRQKHATSSGENGPRNGIVTEGQIEDADD